MRIALQQKLSARRGLFVIVNLAAGVAVYGAIALPIQSFLADRDVHISEQQEQVARLQGVVEQASSVRKIIDNASAARNPLEFLHGANENVIAANLQTQLTSMTQSAGGRIRSIRALQPSVHAGVRYLGAHVDMSGALEVLQRTVYSVETATPYLFIVGAVIKPSPQAGVAFGGVQSNAAQPIFDAELDIVGAVEAEVRR
jgi:hypothetical protein